MHKEFAVESLPLVLPIISVDRFVLNMLSSKPFTILLAYYESILTNPTELCLGMNKFVERSKPFLSHH